MTYSQIVSANRASELDAIRSIGAVPGLQRTKALNVLRTLGATEFAYSVSFGKAVARITGDGTIMASPKKVGVAKNSEEAVLGLTEPVLSYEDAATLTGTSTALDNVVIAGSAPANKLGPKGLLIPAGLCLLVAPGGVGKTPLAHMLAAHEVESYGVVRAGEPLAGYSSNRERIARAIATAMYHNSDVVLDSIKDLLSSSGGGAMKGGISREALLDLSSWASTAAALGVTLYVPLNPSSKDLIDGMIEVAASNATLVVANHGNGTNWSWAARTGEGLSRTVASLEFAEERPAVQTEPSTPGGIAMRADPVSKANLRGIVARTQSKI